MISKIQIVTVLLFLVITVSCVQAQSAKEWNKKGQELHDKGKYEEAIFCYNKAIEYDPKYAYAWLNKGHTLYNLAKYEEAIKCFDKVLERVGKIPTHR
jgi:tetratricopeptide (TPR) repeat protein